VKPSIDGRDIGWFFLDSGADVSCISPDAAKKLAMDEVGSQTTAGVVAVSKLRFMRGKELQLGPVRLENPKFLELSELAEIGKAIGVPIAGICGYDVIGRAVFDIDPTRSTLSILAPGKATLPIGASWTRIQFPSNTPTVSCRFSGGNGVFSIDTGSDSTVDFFSPAVEHYGWLEQPGVERTHTGGAGGSAESHSGKIGFFELGGTTFKTPKVGMQTTKLGAFANPYLTGNVGNGFLAQFRLILDYANERVAFVPIPSKTSS